MAEISQYFNKGDQEKSHKSILSGERPPKMEIMSASKLRYEVPMRDELSQETIDMMISSGLARPVKRNNFLEKNPETSYFSKKNDAVVERGTVRKQSAQESKVSNLELGKTIKESKKRSILVNSKRGEKNIPSKKDSGREKSDVKFEEVEQKNTERERRKHEERERRVKNLRFQENLKKIQQMPSIHEMASAHYCPPPMIYEKVTDFTYFYQKVVKRRIAYDPNQHGDMKMSMQSDYYTKVHREKVSNNGESERSRKKKKRKKKKRSEESLSESDQDSVHQNAAPPNFIVLNENATRNLLQDQNFQLKMNGGTLLDIFLNELAGLKYDSQGEQRPFKIVVEHNQPMNYQQQENKSNIKNSQAANNKQKPRKNSVNFNLSHNSSMGNNSNFWESQGTKKEPSELRSRDDRINQLASIKESEESAHHSRVEDSVKRSELTYKEDFPDYDYSVSQTLMKDSALASVGNKYNNYVKQNNNKSKITDKSSVINIEESFNPQESYPADFESYHGEFSSYKKTTENVPNFNDSESQSKSGSYFGKGDGLELQKCASCSKMFPKAKFIHHIRECLMKGNNDVESKSIIEESVKSKGMFKRMKSSVSNEFRESQYDDIGFSASKSSFMKSGNDFGKKSYDVAYEDDFEDDVDFENYDESF